MLRRNTETVHTIADNLFLELGITDLQGLLKEGDAIACGIECYQLDQGKSFNLAVNKEEIDRYNFCHALGAPYYVVASSPSSKQFQIFGINDQGNEFIHLETLDETSFLAWWKQKQSFTQKKGMYEAQARIEDSYIDKLLFSNDLAWGVNIDGFKLDSTGNLLYIIEKRITGRDVTQYDPNRFFHGTRNKSGDYPSWKILKDLADRLKVPLLLATFDKTSPTVGLTRIMEVSARDGLSYSNKINLFSNNQQIQAEISRLITL